MYAGNPEFRELRIRVDAMDASDGVRMGRRIREEEAEEEASERGGEAECRRRMRRRIRAMKKKRNERAEEEGTWGWGRNSAAEQRSFFFRASWRRN
jgi:hypothetical protein